MLSSSVMVYNTQYLSVIPTKALCRSSSSAIIGDSAHRTQISLQLLGVGHLSGQFGDDVLEIPTAKVV